MSPGATLSSSLSGGKPVCAFTAITRPLYVITAANAGPCTSNPATSAYYFLPAPGPTGKSGQGTASFSLTPALPTGTTFTVVSALVLPQSATSFYDVTLKVDTWIDDAGPGFVMVRIKQGGAIQFVAIPSPLGGASMRWAIVSTSPSNGTYSLVDLEPWYGDASKAYCFDLPC